MTVNDNEKLGFVSLKRFQVIEIVCYIVYIISSVAIPSVHEIFFLSNYTFLILGKRCLGLNISQIYYLDRNFFLHITLVTLKLQFKKKYSRIVGLVCYFNFTISFMICIARYIEKFNYLYSLI